LEEYKHFCALLRDYMKYQNSPDTITPAKALGELDSAGKLIVCPQLMQIVRAALCLPTHSASVERGVIKHRLTSKMGILVFDALMRLRMLCGEYMPLQGNVSVELLVENMKNRSELIDEALLVLRETGSMREEKLPDYMKRLGAISQQVVEISILHGLKGVDKFAVDLEHGFAAVEEEEEPEPQDALPQPPVQAAGQDDEFDRELGLID
jgi:hypothetical protein